MRNSDVARIMDEIGGLLRFRGGMTVEELSRAMGIMKGEHDTYVMFTR